MLISRERNYTHGDCWLFALELRRFTGWEVVETWDMDGKGKHHLLCKAPDGRFIDATGWCYYPGIREWSHSYEDMKKWGREYGCIYPETRDYLTFDVETLLFSLGIMYVTPRGHCVLTELGIKS